jgi:hypothetical protein
MTARDGGHLSTFTYASGASSAIMTYISDYYAFMKPPAESLAALLSMPNTVRTADQGV